MEKKILGLLLLVAFIYGCAAEVEKVATPGIVANDQTIKDNSVVIAKVVAAEKGWMVIHTEEDGKPGQVIGYASVNAGENTNVVVECDVEKATEKLFAMLHVDKAGIGIYEFPGEDVPVKVDDKTVVVGFNMMKGIGTETEVSPEQTGEEVREAPGEIKEVLVTAKQWEFIPSTIEVDKGDTVRLRITSIDVTHGFRLADFGIDERLEPNEEVIVELVADKQGEFAFYCNVPCGAGHSGMGGSLVVK